MKPSKEEILQQIKEKGYKLSKLSEQIGCYSSKLTEWSRGRTSLSPEEMGRLIGIIYEQGSLANEHYSDYYRLNPEDKALVDSMIRQLLKKQSSQ